MSEDDTRGNESPDRRDAPTETTDYRPILEAIDTHAKNLLERVEADTALSPGTRRSAKRHCRELRAELESAWRHLPAATDRRAPTRDRREGAVSVVTGPMEAVIEAARLRGDDGRCDDLGTTPVRDSETVGDSSPETADETGTTNDIGGEDNA